MQNLLQDCTLYADWSKFELLMFNIIQNAVKYNLPGGKILIIMKVVRSFDFKKGAMIETHIVDTGNGICPKRQHLLFQPFLELQAKQSFEKVQDRTTGIGLANSKLIATKLDGDVFITKSKPQFTVFTSQIPIEAICNQPDLPPSQQSQEFEQVQLSCFEDHPDVLRFLETMGVH